MISGCTGCGIHSPLSHKYEKLDSNMNTKAARWWNILKQWLYHLCKESCRKRKLQDPAPGSGVHFPGLPGAGPPCWSCPSGCNLRTSEGMMTVLECMCDGVWDKDGWQHHTNHSYRLHETVGSYENPWGRKQKSNSANLSSLFSYHPLNLQLADVKPQSWKFNIRISCQPIYPSGPKKKLGPPPFPRNCSYKW